MCEHTNLSAMVGFMSDHVAQHFHADRPRLGPSVSNELLNAGVDAERLRKHLRATSGTLGKCRTGLLRRAVCAVELCRNFHVGSGQPDPLGAHIVHVGKDRRDGTDITRRFGTPCVRFEMFDKDLIQAVVGSKHPGCGWSEARINFFVLTRGHARYSSSHDTAGLAGLIRAIRLLAYRRIRLRIFDGSFE